LAALTSIAAELRGSIGTYIPQIIRLLATNDRDDRAAVAAALSKLSEHGM
jgi:hypothetical protein